MQTLDDGADTTLYPGLADICTTEVKARPDVAGGPLDAIVCHGADHAIDCDSVPAHVASLKAS